MSNMVVRTNVFALNAHRNMKNVGLEQGRASNRLSSGFRINSAADDAAGLAISETMRAQIRGLDQASRNAQDGQAMILTTEGGLEEIGNMLQRVRELLVQASNDTNTQDQRNMIEQEISQLGQEIGSMQQRVEFNTNRVLAMGPAIDQALNESMADLQADSRRVSYAFGSLDDNRALVNEAREMLSTLEGTATRAILNTRQLALLDNALGHVWLSSSDLGGAVNNVDTNIPANILGLSSEYMRANASLSELGTLIDGYETAYDAVKEFSQMDHASIDAVIKAMADYAGAADVVTALKNILTDADATALAALLPTLAASGGGEVNISAWTDAQRMALSRFIAATSGVGVGAGQDFRNTAINALNASRNYVIASGALYDAGFGTTGVGDLAAAKAARDAVQGALDAYIPARDLAETAPAGSTHYTNYNTARETLGTALAGMAFDPPPVTLTQYIGFLNTRATAISGRASVLNSARNEMTVEANSINENIADWRNSPTTGNYIAFFQVGANANQGISFDFENVSRAVSAAASVVRVADIMVANPETGGGIGRGVEISPLINSIQSSLDDINRVRANLGAVQNRMDYTMRSLDISSENLSDSESRVRNADVAREMMRFTMANVLQQASVSMLAQANQMPNNLLQLLR